jgi:replicative DNA helicase
LSEPPVHIESERNVLGSMLMYPDCILEVVDILGKSNEMFYAPEHRHIYAAILGLLERNRPINHDSAIDQLREDGKLEDAGDVTYLFDLKGYGATAMQYADIVREKHLLREIHIECSRVALEAITKGAGKEFVDAAHSRLLRLFETTERHYPKRISEFTGAVVAELQAAADGLPHNEGWSTGYPTLDEIHWGYVPGLYIIAARPSVGKTTLAANIAINLAEKAHQVLFFTMEMSSQQITRKVFAFRAGINWGQIRVGFQARAQLQKAVAAEPHIARLPVWIDDTPGLTLSGLRAKIRRHAHEYGPTVIFLDYVQLLEHKGDSKSRYIDVGEISRMLKRLALEHECPIVALSQLSREAEDAPEPKLSWLRESGNLEQDADVCLFLTRKTPEAAEKMRAKTNTTIQFENLIDIDVLKHRDGPVGKMKLYFDREIQAFRETTVRPDPPRDYSAPQEEPAEEEEALLI